MSYHAAFDKNGNLIGLYKNNIPLHVRASAEEFITINNLDHLIVEMNRRDKHTEEVLFSDGDFLDKCLNKLNDLGASCEKLKQEGKKAVVEVKSLGASSVVNLKNNFTELFNNIMEKDSSEFPYQTKKDIPHSNVMEKDSSDIFPPTKKQMPYG